MDEASLAAVGPLPYFDNEYDEPGPKSNVFLT